ncbi:MAG: ABC transporter ATP-binding protein [Mycoplasmataceae bacterium]|nr:ABC transporter ATP-binding protein [Mycoplasmataceae bacterium]
MSKKQSKSPESKLQIFQLFKLFSEFFKADKIFVIICLMISAISAGSIIFAAIFTGITLDEFIQSFNSASPGKENITDQELTNIVYKFLITLSAYVIYFITNHSLFMITISLSYRSGSRIRRAVFEKLISVSVNYIDKNKAGELISRTTTDVDQLISNSVQMFSSLFISPFIILASIVALLIYSPILAIITFLMMSVFFAGSILIAKSAAPDYSNMQEKVGDIGAFSEEHIKNKMAIYLFRRQEKVVKEFDDINNKHAYHFWKAEYKTGILWPYTDLTENLLYGIIYIVGLIFIAFNVPHGGIEATLTLGTITSFVLMVRQVTGELGNMARFATFIQKIIFSAKRISEILMVENDINIGKKEVNNLDGDIVFKNVNFSYENGPTIIKDFNLHVRKGQKVAIVGPTGSGKTTLINLLLRFYELDSGSIEIGGQDIQHLDKYNLRKFISVVLQEVSLFSESIATNIAYGHNGGEANINDIKKAAKEIGSDHFINLLPNNFSHIVEDSNDFSAGESQLLSLTRAYYSPSNILILDEATSNVDSKTEHHVQKGILKIMESKTTFVIAHRLSTIVNSDIIIVMKDGVIIEQGVHQDLLKLKGFYHKLYNSNILENEE